MVRRALRVFEAALEPSHPRIAAARELLGRWHRTDLYSVVLPAGEKTTCQS